MTDYIVQQFTLQNVNSDWHDNISVQTGELIEHGFDIWGGDAYQLIKWHDAETENRVKQKIELHYKYYEIGITPPGKWRDMLHARLAEIMPKYNYLYDLYDKGLTPFTDSDEWGKGRSLYSDFPQSQLNADSEDYASNATDTQTETMRIGNVLDSYEKYKDYDDIDRSIIKEIQTLFSLTGDTQQW